MVGGVAVKKILAAIDRSKYKEKIIADTVEKAIIDYAQDVILIGTTGMSIAEKEVLQTMSYTTRTALCLQSADMFRFVCCDVPTFLAN